MFAFLLLYCLDFSAGTLISHHHDSGACFRQFIPAHSGFPNARCRFPIGGNPAIKGTFIRNLYTCCRRKQAHGWGYSSLCTPCSAIRGYLHPWSDWSRCSMTCGSGEQERFRICSNGVCSGVRGRRMVETRKCLWNACCSVDGKWDIWSSWSFCGATCGSGLQHRTRSCSTPSPSCGGKACSGYPRQLRRCNIGHCADWSSWESLSPCSVTCGNGMQHRVRNCHNPLDDECKGERESYFPCVAGTCAAHGGWCSWGSWSSCTSSCRNVIGTRKRARACSCPAPKDGGRECEGDDGHVERCSSHGECPVKGQWSKWSSWGECSAKKCSLVSGIQKRFRECNNPLPINYGLPCFGFSIESRECLHMNSCKVNSVYGKWSQWTPCSATCGLCGVKTRTRTCFSPFDSKKFFRTINVIGIPVLHCDASATSSVARCHFGRCPDGSFPCGQDPTTKLDTTSHTITTGHLTTEIPSPTVLFPSRNDHTNRLTTTPQEISKYNAIATHQQRHYASSLLNKITSTATVTTVPKQVLFKTVVTENKTIFVKESTAALVSSSSSAVPFKLYKTFPDDGPVLYSTITLTNSLNKDRPLETTPSSAVHETSVQVQLETEKLPRYSTTSGTTHSSKDDFEDDQVFEAPMEMFKEEIFSGNNAFIGVELTENKVLNGHRAAIKPMIETDVPQSHYDEHINGYVDALDPTNGIDKTNDNFKVAETNGVESQVVPPERVELDNNWEESLTEKIDIKRDVYGKYNPDEEKAIKYFLLGNSDETNENTEQSNVAEDPSEAAEDEHHGALLHFFHVNEIIHAIREENNDNDQRGDVSSEPNVTATMVKVIDNDPDVTQSNNDRNQTERSQIKDDGYEKETGSLGDDSNDSDEEYQYSYDENDSDLKAQLDDQSPFSREKELEAQHDDLLQFFALNTSDTSEAKETINGLSIGSNKEQISLNGIPEPTAEDDIPYEESYYYYDDDDDDIAVDGQEISMEYDEDYEEKYYDDEEEYNDDEDIPFDDSDLNIPESDDTVIDNSLLKLIFADDEDFNPNPFSSSSGESEKSNDRFANRNEKRKGRKEKKQERKLGKLLGGLRKIKRNRKEKGKERRMKERKNKGDFNNYENNEELGTTTEESTTCGETSNFQANAAMNASECCALLGSNFNESNGTDSKGQQIETCLMGFYDVDPMVDLSARTTVACRFLKKKNLLNTICCAKTSCALWTRGAFRKQCFYCNPYCPPCKQMLLNG